MAVVVITAKTFVTRVLYHVAYVLPGDSVLLVVIRSRWNVVVRHTDSSRKRTSIVVSQLIHVDSIKAQLFTTSLSLQITNTHCTLVPCDKMVVPLHVAVRLSTRLSICPVPKFSSKSECRKNSKLIEIAYSPGHV